MGFGIILSSSDLLLRTQLESNPQQAVLDLIEAVGVDAYPVRGTKHPGAGAWTVHGTFHSSSAVAFEMDATGIWPVDFGKDVEEGGQFADVLNTSELYAVEQDIHAHPNRHIQAITAAQTEGLSWVDAEFGPDQTLNTVRSAWYAYADSLPWGKDQRGRDELVRGLLSSVNSRMEQSIGAGSHANALTRIGGLVSGKVALYWAGNRLTRANGLLPDERRVMLRRAGRGGMGY